MLRQWKRAGYVPWARFRVGITPRGYPFLFRDGVLMSKLPPINRCSGYWDKVLEVDAWRSVCDEVKREIVANAKCEIDSLRLEAQKLRKQLIAIEKKLRVAHVRLGTMPQNRVQATKANFKIPAKPGIYFVFSDATSKEVLYVGQSCDLRQRCSLPLTADRCDGNLLRGEWVSWMEVPPEELLFTECLYIGICRPKRNVLTPQIPRRKYSVDVDSVSG